ncbi:MAG: hypothetical protein AAGI48_03630 [Verrucomicrobiota bacterium]
MPGKKAPYLDTWLRRTRRQLAVSGRLRQLALLLSRREGGEPIDWERELSAVLLGDAVPTLDLVTLIDASLAIPAPHRAGPSTPDLF